MYKLVPHRIVGCLPHSSLRQGRCLFLVLCHRASCRGSTCDIDFVIRSINQNQVWLPQTNWYVCERLGGNFHPFEKGFVWSCADARQLIHLKHIMEPLLKGKNVTRIAKEPFPTNWLICQACIFLSLEPLLSLLPLLCRNLFPRFQLFVRAWFKNWKAW